MLHQQRDRAESFGGVAAQYDRTRPTYPAALIDELLADGAHSVLDVGCGTGIASALFAQRGLDVLGVEADERMAQLARGKGIEVETGRFEDWRPDGRSFDLLVAGQAWHWVDPAIGARCAAQALRPGGRIGLFWNFGAPPLELQALLDPIYERLGPTEPGIERIGSTAGGVEPRGEATPDVEQRDATRGNPTIDGLRASGAFEEPEVKRFLWSARYETASWLDQLATHSNHQTLPPQRLAALLQAVGEAIDGVGGSFEVDYQTMLLTARRNGER